MILSPSHQGPIIGSPSARKRNKLWLILPKIFNRRLASQLLFRLPLLAMWSFLVVLFLYVILTNNESEKYHNSPTTYPKSFTTNREKLLNKIEDIDYLNDEVLDIETDTSKPLESLSSKKYKVVRSDNRNMKNQNVILTNPKASSTPTLLNTKKSPISEYSRQGKVFILVIQDENLNFAKHQHQRSHRSTTGPTSTSSLEFTFTKRLINRFIIPPHIKILMNILESHRIDYVIDTTRTGVPSLLLNDREISNEDNLKFPVIVIDDFLKYAKSSRWIRDQLDRHCVKNNIGVISYLNSESQYQSIRPNYAKDTKWDRTTRSIRALLLNQTTSSLQIPIQPPTEPSGTPIENFPLTFNLIEHNHSKCIKKQSSCLIDQQVNDLSPVLRILKRRSGFIVPGTKNDFINQSPWVSISSNHISYQPLTWARFRDEQVESHTVAHNNEDQTKSDILPKSERLVLSIYDAGLFDEIRRVIFGSANHDWINKILLIDSIEHLSRGRIFNPLERFIQIDIDDIFVGEKGIRLKPDDVGNLIETQNAFANLFEGGFKFNLGFSGKYFKHGKLEENDGDEELIRRGKEFTWFCHTWAHTKAHLFNDSKAIANELMKNLKFAAKYNITIIGYPDDALLDVSIDETYIPKYTTYAVAPHHSGVYPIHEQLYDAWLKVLNVQVTSTEEYPALRPASGRRAFVHKTIKVLPRQTCGLYTHTIYRDKYPGGIEKLESSIRGGELFETVLHNPVNIYMTHMSNYANDRLAPYTFSALFDFITNNTNLVLKYAPTVTSKSSSDNDEDGPSLGPAKLADYYIRLHPEEKEPLWTNPCNDKRHLAIWSQDKHRLCSLSPKVLIVGPQKTGTTALQTFLKLNPSFKTNKIIPPDFEEVQFFNDKHYFKGVDWYFSRFLPTDSDNLKTGSGRTTPNGSHFSSDTTENHDIELVEESDYSTNYQEDNNIIYFEKSATYFDDPKVPRRAFNLLPEARIVILLIDPADRAYSWYQHMKAHGDITANAMTFEQIIMSKDDLINSQQTTSQPIVTDNDVSLNSTRIAIRNLRNRCLHPGYYAQHFLRWLQYYPSRQISIVDGQWLLKQPATILRQLEQKILRSREPLDYGKLLVYNREKGFYCVRSSEAKTTANNRRVLDNQHSSKCLGPGKGRKYSAMSQEARLFLNRHYMAYNQQLARILSDIGHPLPPWLQDLATKYI